MTDLRQREKEQIIRETLARVPVSAAGAGGAASQLDANGTILDVDAIANGELLKRVGTSIVGVAPGAPGAHAATHENGGADEISVAGLSGQLADPQPPIIGAGAAQAVAGNDARLTNARTPTAHAASHQDGGTDEISLTGLSGVAADPQHPIIGALATEAVAGNDARLTNARTPTAHVLAGVAGLGAEHTVSGLTARQVLIATGAATALFRALVAADIPSEFIIDTELATELINYVDHTTFDNHKARHQDGGTDEISVTGLSGLLADNQRAIPNWSRSLMLMGG